MAVDYHAMSTATDSGAFQDTIAIVSNTDKRDVSDMLDLLAIDDTPFINRIGWGPVFATQTIEWISENIGIGYVVCGSAMASTATTFNVTTCDGMAVTEVVKQLHEGTLLYNFDATNSEHALYAVTAISTDGDVEVEPLSTLAGTNAGAIAVADKLYILGPAANEGSLPRTGNPRNRAVRINYPSILREDVQITGSMKENDMYAINREDLHQIQMRLIEIKRGMEKQALYSLGVGPRSSTEASVMIGALGFLLGQSGDHIDTSTTVLTKGAFDDVLGACWDNGSTNLTVFGHKDQISKFTDWDINRIRQTPNESLGGGYITRYLSNVGVEVSLVPMRKVPTNILLVLDTSKIKLRAKRNRKAIMEMLGKKGDFDAWQMISEFSMEMKGYDLGQHGVFTKLT